MSPVTVRRIEAAISTLTDLSSGGYEELDGLRDDIGLIVYALDQIIEAKNEARR